MTSRAGLIRRYVGYGIGFVAAFVLWELSSAAAANADDDTRPADLPLTRPLAEPLAEPVARLVEEAAAPARARVGVVEQVTHETTATVRATVHRLSGSRAEQTVEPVLGLVDAAADDLVEPASGPAEGLDGAPAPSSTAPVPPAAAAPQHRADARARTDASRRAASRAAPAATPWPPLTAEVSPQAACEGATRSFAPTPPAARSLDAPTSPGQDAPVDQATPTAAGPAATDAAPALRPTPALQATDAVAGSSRTDPRGPADPLPDCTPD